jgi:hypothetical protein
VSAIPIDTGALANGIAATLIDFGYNGTGAYNYTVSAVKPAKVPGGRRMSIYPEEFPLMVMYRCAQQNG